MVAQPHFLLFCDTHLSEPRSCEPGSSNFVGSGGGRWHFVLEQIDGSERLEAADSEMAVNRERLALLSVVRGLEALEQPSQVTLVTTSRYVSRGLRYGLNTWRDADYKWERFGERRPVRNSDLWRRVDTALQFHGVKCRLIQAGSAADASTVSVASTPPRASYEAAQGLATTTNHPPQDESYSLAPAFLPTHRAQGLAAAQQASYRPTSAAKELAWSGYDRRLQGLWQPSKGGWFSLIWRSNWWNLAASWMRWKRGRMPSRPVFYGT